LPPYTHSVDPATSIIHSDSSNSFSFASIQINNKSHFKSLGFSCSLSFFSFVSHRSETRRFIYSEVKFSRNTVNRITHKISDWLSFLSLPLFPIPLFLSSPAIVPSLKELFAEELAERFFLLRQQMGWLACFVTGFGKKSIDQER
jgi:hypothetical protein